jgi:hypothetical protein
MFRGQEGILRCRAQNSGIQQNPWVDADHPNDPQKSKSVAYNNSMFYTTAELASLDDWNFETITKRGSWLEFLVAELFHPVTGSHTKYVSFPDWLAQNN